MLYYVYACCAILRIIIVHAPLLYMVSEVAEGDRFVEMVTMNLQPPDHFASKTQKSGQSGNAALNNIVWHPDWLAKAKAAK